MHGEDDRNAPVKDSAVKSARLITCTRERRATSRIRPISRPSGAEVDDRADAAAVEISERVESVRGQIEPGRAGLVYIDVHGAGVYPHSATGKETNMSTTKSFVVSAGGGKALDMTAPGRFAALKLLGHETNESIMLFEETAPVGTKSLFHPHRDSDEVAWVLAGEITFKIGDDVIVGGPGTCAFFPRNVPHAWKNTGSETRRVLFLYTPAAAGRHLQALFNRPAPLNHAQPTKLPHPPHSQLFT